MKISYIPVILSLCVIAAAAGDDEGPLTAMMWNLNTLPLDVERIKTNGANLVWLNA